MLLETTQKNGIVKFNVKLKVLLLESKRSLFFKALKRINVMQLE